MMTFAENPYGILKQFFSDCLSSAYRTSLFFGAPSVTPDVGYESLRDESHLVRCPYRYVREFQSFLPTAHSRDMAHVAICAKPQPKFTSFTDVTSKCKIIKHNIFHHIVSTK